MKKIYQAPKVYTQNIIVEHMILVGSDPQAAVDPSKKVNASALESRRNCFDEWDAED